MTNMQMLLRRKRNQDRAWLKNGELREYTDHNLTHLKEDPECRRLIIRSIAFSSFVMAKKSNGLVSAVEGSWTRFVTITAKRIIRSMERHTISTQSADLQVIESVGS